MAFKFDGRNDISKLRLLKNHLIWKGPAQTELDLGEGPPCYF